MTTVDTMDCGEVSCEYCTKDKCIYIEDTEEKARKRMRLIDADELIEHAWRDKLDSRELIAEMINNAPTVKDITTQIPISIFEKLISQESKIGHCKDCKHFCELPYHTETLGRCINHSEFCPKGDWFCADFEPQEKEV